MMFPQSCSNIGNKAFCHFKDLRWIWAGKSWSQVYLLVHRWKQCLDMKKEAVCLQLTLFHGLLQNDVCVNHFF